MNEQVLTDSADVYYYKLGWDEGYAVGFEDGSEAEEAEHQ